MNIDHSELFFYFICMQMKGRDRKYDLHWEFRAFYLYRTEEPVILLAKREIIKYWKIKSGQSFIGCKKNMTFLSVPTVSSARQLFV